jgi:hypothetical protein
MTCNKNEQQHNVKNNLEESFKRVKIGLLVPTSWRMILMRMCAVCPSVNEKQCCCLRNKRKQWGRACIRSDSQNYRKWGSSTAQLLQFLLFIKSQFTKKCSNCLPLYPCTQGHFWSGTFPPILRILRSWGGCGWFDRNQYALVKRRFIFYWSWIHYTFQVSPARKLRDWSWENAEAVPCTLSVCEHILVWNFLLALVWGTRF